MRFLRALKSLLKALRQTFLTLVVMMVRVSRKICSLMSPMVAPLKLITHLMMTLVTLMMNQKQKLLTL